MEAHAGAKVLQLSCSDVAGHDNDGVFKVHLASQAIGQVALVKHLQQHVEHVGMRFLDFVEQHHTIGVTAHLLGQLAALFIAHIARRRAHEPGDVEFLHIFAHIDANQGLVAVEQELSQLFGQQRLAHARRSKEHKRTDGTLGVTQAGAVAADAAGDLVDGLVLADDLLFQLIGHAQQAYALALGNALGRNAGHHGYNLGNVVLVNGHAAAIQFGLPALFGLL